MREKIIEVLFEGWCDGDCELKKYDPDYETVLNLIREHTNADNKEQRRIENAICGLVCEAERNAFMNGVYACLELINGNIFKKAGGEE